MDIAQLLSDETLEEEGIWFDYPGFDDVKFLIGRLGNEAYIEKMERLSAKVRDKIRKDTLDAEAQRVLYDKALCGTVILGWSGLTDGKGTKKVNVKFSDAAAFKLLQLPGASDLRDWLVAKAADASHFKHKEGDSIVGLAEIVGRAAEKT